MYDQDNPYEEVLPQLVSLERKKSPSMLKSGRNNIEQKFLSKQEQSRISPIQVPQTISKDPSSRVPEQISKAKQMENELKTKNTQKINELSKNLIAEMMNKISLKSISEQNYPVSNETVQRLMVNLQEQIRTLTQEINKFQNSLLINPTNQHMKKQLQSHQKNLNQLKTIKDLYNQKIENRSKVSDLQSKIMELKSENRQLKIKIARGIQKIQSHIHNLPCQKEKELIEEVNKYKLALNRQKQMRENLELNIQNINLNFKRFYEEADKSRKIVTEQLKNVQKKQQELKNKEDKLNHQKNQQKTFGDAKSSKGNNMQGSSDIFLRKITNRISDGENIAEIINQINQNQYEDQLKRTRGVDNKLHTKTNEKTKNNINNPNAALLAQTTRPKFNLEEQIEKMRMNQSQISRYTKKKS